MDLKNAISKIKSSQNVVCLLICAALLATSLMGATAVGANPIQEESIVEGELEVEDVEEETPEGELSLLAVSPIINYQGRLLQDGQPVDGAQIMLFGLYDEEFAGVPVWQEIASVTVNGGLFTHALGSVIPLSSEYFDRQLWLQIQVGTTTLPRQKLMACPYAMSVMPGATTSAWLSDRPAFAAKNYAGTGLEATSDSDRHPALKVHNSYGGPLIAAWGDGVKRMELDQNGNLWIKGQLTAEGAAPTGRFPEPDFDLGWEDMDPGQEKWIPHNLGGDPDRYFIDFMFKNSKGTFGRTIHGYGGFCEGLDRKGVYWKQLDSEKFILIRHSDDEYADKVRVRIWVY